MHSRAPSLSPGALVDGPGNAIAPPGQLPLDRSAPGLPLGPLFSSPGATLFSAADQSGGLRHRSVSPRGKHGSESRGISKGFIAAPLFTPKAGWFVRRSHWWSATVTEPSVRALRHFGASYIEVISARSALRSSGVLIGKKRESAPLRGTRR